MSRKNATTAKSFLGIGAMLGGLLLAAPVGAETPLPRCNDLGATMFIHQPTEDVVGTAGDDVIIVFLNGPGATVKGLGGNDTICLEGSADFDVTVEGGAGDDTIFGYSRFGQLTTKPEYDRATTILNGGRGNDEIHGGSGFDIIDGGDGDDVIFGYQDFDVLNGGSGNDEIHGGQSADLIMAGGGDDKVYGGPDDDEIHGGLGKDTLFGGAGNDILLSHTDLYDEDANGIPSAGITEDPAGINSVSIDLDIAGARMFGGAGNDLLIGSNRWDRMQGGNGNDVLFGLEGRDWMRGGAGNDIIFGGLNVDDVNGNLGKDEIIMIGPDVVSGGFGEDSCFYGPFSAQSALTSCETVEVAGPEYNNVRGRISQRILFG